MSETDSAAACGSGALGRVSGVSEVLQVHERPVLQAVVGHRRLFRFLQLGLEGFGFGAVVCYFRSCGHGRSFFIRVREGKRVGLCCRLLGFVSRDRLFHHTRMRSSFILDDIINTDDVTNMHISQSEKGARLRNDSYILR